MLVAGSAVADPAIGEYQSWTGSLSIVSDNCVDFPLMGRKCTSVDYNYECRGRIIGVDVERRQFEAQTTECQLVWPDGMNVGQMRYKQRAIDKLNANSIMTVSY